MAKTILTEGMVLRGGEYEAIDVRGRNVMYPDKTQRHEACKCNTSDSNYKAPASYETRAVRVRL